MDFESGTRRQYSDYAADWTQRVPIPGQVKRFSSTSNSLDRLWDSTSLLPNTRGEPFTQS